jgi:predicted nuclease of predicted toxin-antitoxin system
MEKARQEGRVVLTCDLDFADLLAIGAHTLPSVILLRLQNQTPAAVNPRLSAVLSECREALMAGAIVTVEETHYRLRRLPIEPSLQ